MSDFNDDYEEDYHFNVDHFKSSCYINDSNAGGSDFNDDNFEDCYFTDGYEEDGFFNDGQGVIEGYKESDSQY